MALIDITLPIDDNIPVWPGDSGFKFYADSRIKAGSSCNVSSFKTSCHAGTHMDAPWHFIDNGEKIDEISPELLIGEVLIIDLSGIEGNIEKEHISSIPQGTKRLIIKTSNSLVGYTREFNRDFIGITPSSAKALVDKGVMLLGLDYLSIAALTDDIEESHRIFLGREGVAALEGLNLMDVAQGTYRLICMPLLIKGADGAPARVMLETIETSEG